MSERRAVVLLLALGVAGTTVRLILHPPIAPGAIAYQPASGEGRLRLDTVAARASRLARPLHRGETIDFDAASVEDLARLPRIGPGLAERIVKNREEHGPFGSLEALRRVSGVGPTTLEAVRPYAIFSGAAEIPGFRDPAEGRIVLRPGEQSLLLRDSSRGPEAPAVPLRNRRRPRL